MNARTAWMGDAPAAAWAVRMARGQGRSRAPSMGGGRTAADARGVESITHRCEGCASGQPCSSCGGNIARSHPAYQALEWALLQTRSHHVEPWVGVARVENALRDARPQGNSPEWAAIVSLVESGAFLAADLGITEEKWVRDHLQPPSGSPGGPGGRFPLPPGRRRRVRCCIDRFDYPQDVFEAE